MSTHPHRRRVWKWLWFLAVPLLFSLGGCISSGTYHVQMSMGLRPARPYPLIRYWAEFSSEEFHDNVLAVPLFGVPGIIPFEYLENLCVDTLFLPIDWPLSYFASDPTVQCIPLEDDTNRLEVSFSSIPLHKDLSQCQGIVALDIEVLQGSLEIRLDGEAYTPDWIKLTPDACFCTHYDTMFKHNEILCDTSLTQHRWTLYCTPPVSPLPTFFLPALASSYIPWVISATTFQLCPSDFPAERLVESLGVDYDSGKHVATKHLDISSYKRLQFVPSEDFVGHVTWESEPISEVVFTEK